MAIPACWPGEEQAAPEAAALTSRKAYGFGSREAFESLLINMKSRGEGKFGRLFSPCWSSKSYLARYSSQMFTLDVAQGTAERGFGQQNKFLIIAHNSLRGKATIQTKSTRHQMHHLFNKVNFQGKSRQLCHFEGPDETP